jgi:hypothetical protein
MLGTHEDCVNAFVADFLAIGLTLKEDDFWIPASLVWGLGIVTSA